MAPFRLSAFGLPAFPSLLPPPVHHGPIDPPDSASRPGRHHLAPPLVQGCGRNVIADPLSRIGARHVIGPAEASRARAWGAACNSRGRVVPTYTASFIPTFWLGLGLDSDAPGLDRARSLHRKPLSRLPSHDRWTRTRKQVIKCIYLVRYTTLNPDFYIPTPMFVPSSYLGSSLRLLTGYVG
jgi:hypothetical protein